MDAERRLLSRILLSGELKTALERKIRPDMFSDQRSRLAYAYILKFYKEHGQCPSIDLIEETFTELKLAHTKEPASFFIDKLLENYVRNKGSKMLLDSARLLVSDPLRGLEQIRAGVAQLSIETDPTVDVDVTKTLDERIARYLRVKDLAGAVDGLSTPWEILNQATMGWHNGEFIAIVARPATGKTWLLVVLAEYSWRDGERVLFVTNEMSTQQIERRFDAAHFKLPYQEFRAGLLPDYLEKQYFDGIKKIKPDVPLIVIDNVGGVSAISAKIDQYKPTLVLIDGMYLLEDDQKGESKWDKTTNVSRDLKKLAKKKSVPIITTTQFNRAADEAKVDRVTLANIGFADSIGQDADVVLGMFRSRDMESNNELLVRVMKIREGEPDDFILNWDFHRMEFTQIGRANDDRVPVDPDTASNDGFIDY